MAWSFRAARLAEASGAEAVAHCSLLFSGAGGSGGASLVQTLTLANTSGSDTATHSHTPSYCLKFKEGDVPSGTYPALQTSGGTNVPYTYWGKQTWSDGSLSLLAVLPRFPDAVSGSGSASLKVYNGGSAQSASARTLAEVYAASIKVKFNTGLDNASGDYVADIQAANIVETLDYGDGPAGRYWRFLVEAKQGGSAHGQIHVYFYVMALQDNSGNLAGFRVVPMIAQPWYNHDTPAKDWRSFTSITMEHGAGPTTVDMMASYSAKTFSYASTDLLTVTSHGMTQGVAVRLTTTGTLPTGLSTGTTYWVKYNNANSMYLQSGSNEGATQVSITGAGSGTHTMTPIPYFCHFGGAFIATTDARWIYVQGGGSVATDPTLRLQADKTYEHTTKKLPPWETSLTTVGSNTTYTWTPYQHGALTPHISGAGERLDIGVFNELQVRQWHTQAAIDERIVRLTGMCGVHHANNVRDKTTKNWANLSNTSYTGMPAAGATSLRWSTSVGATGFTSPSHSNAWTQVFSGNDISHQTPYAAPAYLLTGEMQYYDIAMGEAGQGNLQHGAAERNPTGYYGIGPYTKDSYRTGFWSMRNIVHAAAISMDNPPDSSGHTTYIRALAAAQFTYLTAWVASQAAWWATSGFFAMEGVDNGRGSWQIGYGWQTCCYGAGSLEDSNAMSMVNHFKAWPIYILAQTGNLWCLATYYELSSKTNNNLDAPYLDGDGQWGPWANVTNLSWAITGDLFTWNTPNFTPANGDKVMFWSLARPGTNFSYNTVYYAVNVSGNTFQLSATQGGSAVVVQGNDSLTGGSWGSQRCYPQFAITIIPANPPSTSFAQGSVSGSSYGANQYGCVNWSMALGSTGLSAISSELATRLTSVNFNNDPKYRYGTSF